MITAKPMLNGKIKRPLIEFEKRDILEFATNKKLVNHIKFSIFNQRYMDCQFVHLRYLGHNHS